MAKKIQQLIMGKILYKNEMSAYVHRLYVKCVDVVMMRKLMLVFNNIDD